MATIRNSLSMTDRMSPTLRAVMRAMESTLKVMQRLDAEADKGVQSKAYRQAEKDIQRANNALKKLDNYTDMVADSALRGERAYSRMGGAVRSMFTKVQGLGGSFSTFLQSLSHGVFLAQKLSDAVGDIMQKSDASMSQVARIGLYNTSEYTNEQLYGQVFSTAMQTRTGLSDTADLVNKILLSGVYTGTSATQSAIGTAGIINRALVAGGGTNEENQRALRQLTQGLSSGILQGEELRSIREQTPYFARILAEGLAKVDEKFEGIGIGDLKELGAQGELTADRVIKAMWSMQDEITSDFKAMPKTFGQAMTSMSNIWQYFLWMLSDADGPLGKINERLWTFVDYLQSDKGLDLLQDVAVGVNIICTALAAAMDALGSFVVFLQENTAIAQACFITIGVYAAVSAAAAIAAWVAATWYILVAVAAVGLIAWAFLRAGYTAQEVVGAIAGGVLWLGALIWDTCVVLILGILGIVNFLLACLWDAVIWLISLVMWVVSIILTVVISVVSAIIKVIQTVIQIIVWAVMVIITVLKLIGTVVETIGLLIEGAFASACLSVVATMYGLADTVLDVLGLIAKGIDAVFGSNLADTVSDWSGTLESKFTQYVEEHDPKTVSKIGDLWNQFGSDVADMFTSDKYNLYGERKFLQESTDGLIDSVWSLRDSGEDFLEGIAVNPADAASALFDPISGLMINPEGAFDTGYNWGSGLVDEIGDLNLGIPTDSIFGQLDANGIQVAGGYLDGIKSDVNISDEDVQLLRDMAARDVLLQLQTITPVANVTFGDVRETADVNKILDVIEQMVDEQMATAMVS